MENYFKRIRLIILGSSLLILLAGCGDGGNKVPAKEFQYIPNYVKLDLECDYISQVAGTGDSLFLYGSTWNEETEEEKSYLYKYNLNDESCEQLSIQLGENDYLSNLMCSPDGNLIALVNKSTYDTLDNGEMTNYRNAFELWQLSAEDGKILNSKDITPLIEDVENSYIQYLCMDGAGNYYMTIGDQGVTVLDKAFNKLGEIPVNTWVNAMVTSKEGDVYISFYGETGPELHKLDLASKSIGEKLSEVSGYGNRNYYAGVSQSLIMSDSNKVAFIDTATGTQEELFGWLDVDINGDDVTSIGELSDGRIWAVLVSHSEDATNTELVYFAKTKASEVEQKEVLTYGALWLDSDIRKSIIDFNKTNDTYRISVKEYATDDYEAGLNQMNADITGSNCPDIIDLSGVSFNQYATKGVFEDLYPYMEKSGIKRDEYLENILKAYELDGKLYGLTPKFYVTTTMAKASKLGDRTGWTLTEMLDFIENEDPNYIFEYGSRYSIFYYCIFTNISEFIDWETGECSFTGEDFIRTLEFAAKFPKEVNYDEEREGTEELLRNDKLLLLQSSISSVQEFQMMKGFFGEKVAYIGYPNSERKGNMIQPTGGSVAMSSKSKNKDGAWVFMQSLISEESQNAMVDEFGSGWGFPIKKSALNKQFELDMKKEYYKDETGKEVEQPKMTWGYDDFEIEIYAASQEEVDEVMRLLESAQVLAGGINEQLVQIMEEETESFFSGQKSAQAAADVIQNRIQIYVNENR